MTKKEALEIIIRRKGICKFPINAPDGYEDVECDECELIYQCGVGYNDAWSVAAVKERYQLAFNIYLKKYGTEEELVEILL